MINEIIKLKKKLSDREEQIVKLECERRNSRILLDYLEYLVGCQQKSKRPATIMRQKDCSQSTNSGTSEIEIIDALRSLSLQQEQIDKKQCYSTIGELTNVNHEPISIESNVTIGIQAKNSNEQKSITRQNECSQSTNSGTSEIEIIDALRSLSLQQEQIDKKQCYSTIGELTNVNHEPISIESNVTIGIQAKNSNEQKCYQQKSKRPSPIMRQNECSQSTNSGTSEIEIVDALRSLSLQQEQIDKKAFDRYAQLSSPARAIEQRYLKEYKADQHKIFKLEKILFTKDIALKQVEEKYDMIKNRFDGLSFQIHNPLLISHKYRNYSTEERLHIILNNLKETRIELETTKQRLSQKEECIRKLTSDIENILLESWQNIRSDFQNSQIQNPQTNIRLMLECDKIRRLLRECIRETASDQIPISDQSEDIAKDQFCNEFHIDKAPVQNDLNDIQSAPYVDNCTENENSFDLQDEHNYLQNLQDEDIQRAKRVDHAADQGMLTDLQSEFRDLHRINNLLDSIDTNLRTVNHKFTDESRNDQFGNVGQEDSIRINRQNSLLQNSSHGMYRSSPMLSCDNLCTSFYSSPFKNLPRAQSSHCLLSRSLRNTCDDMLHASYESITNPNSKYGEVAYGSVNYGTYFVPPTYYDTVNSEELNSISSYFIPFAGKELFGDCSTQSNAQQRTAQISNISHQFNSEYNKRFDQEREILKSTLHNRTPFIEWDTASVIGWLELCIGMPLLYVEAFCSNVGSAECISNLSDYEMQQKLWIDNPLHRMKLQLAIREIIDYTSRTTTRDESFQSLEYITISKETNHEWVANQWLSSLGLQQYKNIFMDNLVDTRMLAYLTEEHMITHLNIIDFGHRKSINFGVELLRKFDFNKFQLEEKRLKTMTADTDLLVWTNQELQSWLMNNGLSELNRKMPESGIHGALIVLDYNFNAMEFATRLSISTSDNLTRQLLQLKFDKLINNYKTSLIIGLIDEVYAGED
ncbi:hypothetical protein GJ496_008212 [Pomphorhynchus laevis]|nr:hypothetical protein GJ496_008212 [Pomphorhynchus laevis]